MKKIDKINKDFLWGSSTEKKKITPREMEQNYQAKEEGGLGIQAARARNIVLLAKLNWRMY